VAVDTSTAKAVSAIIKSAKNFTSTTRPRRGSSEARSLSLVEGKHVDRRRLRADCLFVEARDPHLAAALASVPSTRRASKVLDRRFCALRASQSRVIAVKLMIG
jgi:hypothetical protein